LLGFFYFYKMNIKNYLDSTYLKTAKQANLSEVANQEIVIKAIQEAIKEGFKLVMIRPENVALAKKMIADAKSNLAIGTIIDFPKGISETEIKIKEAQKAIENGADELDFVCNYSAFKKSEIAFVKKEILDCTKLGLDNNKIVKWIIEVAALNNHQIIQLSTLIKNVVISNFKDENFASVFVKSSTGFFKTKNNLPNGATLESIIMMLENASPLSIKASGGITNKAQAEQYIRLGVKRIGTSSAKAIVNDEVSNNGY
jgi:deoxyribose-phosphate aldolase